MRLSTTEPANQVGVLKIRQDDKGTQKIVARITTNSKPQDLTGLEVAFNMRTNDGNVVIEKAVVKDAKLGIIEYVVSGYATQQAGRNNAYFSFFIGENEEFSTKDFSYFVTNSVTSEGIKGCDYIWRFEDLLRKFQEFIDSGQTDFETWFETIKDTLGEDAAGNLAMKIVQIFGDMGKLEDFRNWDDSIIKKMRNEFVTRGINIEWFGSIGDGIEDDTESFRNALLNAQKYNTFINIPPGRFLISGLGIQADENVTIVGAGKDKTVLVGPPGKSLIFSRNDAIKSGICFETIKKSDNKITLSDSVNLKKGQLICFTTTERVEETAFPWTRSHSALISNIDGNDVYIDRPFPTSMSSGYKISFSVYNVGKLGISNLTVQGDLEGQLLDIKRSSAFNASNLKFIGLKENYDLADNGTNAFRISDSVDAFINEIEFENICYGVLPTNGSNNTMLLNSKAHHCRHIAAPSGSQASFLGKNLTTFDCYAGIDSHQGSILSIYDNVSTFNDSAPIKLRGRKDYLLNSKIGGDLEMRNDNPLFTSAEARDDLDKVLVNVSLDRGFVGVAKNIKVDNLILKGSFISTAPGGGVLGDSLVIDKMRMYPGDYYINNEKKIAFWLGWHSLTDIKNVQMYGPNEGMSQNKVDTNNATAIYVDRSPKLVSALENISIDGFTRGIEFLGALNASNLNFKNITVSNCGYGLDPRTSYKDNATIENLKFSGNYIDVEELFRFRNLMYTSNNTMMLPKTFFGTEIPTIGTFKLGDRMLNMSPAAGGDCGWICVTSGTPGVWKSTGKIAN